MMTIIFQFMESLRPFMFLHVLFNHVFLVLSLYQLVASSHHLTPLRYLKFLGTFYFVLCEFYVMCNSSEMSDECNIMLANAIKFCSWGKCTNRTRRDLCIILARVQRPNHLAFHNGVIVLGYTLFLKTTKAAYSYVNFMGTVK
uniref:Uncharacterized protein n=1 Tax=Cacopsylla melanoneura TaxID=428564 RepID=A0A8D9BI19_9HEMI